MRAAASWWPRNAAGTTHGNDRGSGAEEHILQRLEAVLDLSFVYEETARLYSRPPIDPVVLVKYLLVGFLYGIPSERQIEQRI